MMAAVRGWLTAVVIASVLIAAADALLPPGTLRSLFSLTGGVVLLMVLLGPLTHADLSALRLDFSDCVSEVDRRQEELQKEEERQLAAGIAERTEAYIRDKAAQLGIDCTVRVETAPDAAGVPCPSSAALSCSRSAALSEILEQELGIPAERQRWNTA